MLFNTVLLSIGIIFAFIAPIMRIVVNFYDFIETGDEYDADPKDYLSVIQRSHNILDPIQDHLLDCRRNVNICPFLQILSNK